MDQELLVRGGTFTGIERIEFTSPTDASVDAPPGNGADLLKLHMIGSRGADVFEVRGGSDTFDLQGGNAGVVLNADAVDQVTVTSLTEGKKHVYAFGAGDTVTVFDGQTGPFSIIEANGSTILAGTGEGQTGSIVIDAVGLVQSGNGISTTFSFGSSTIALGAAPPAWPRVAPSDEPPSPKGVWGTTGNGTIAGAAGRERIFAGGGDDRVTGGNGDDLIYAL